MNISPQLLKLRDHYLRAGIVDELQLRSAFSHLEKWGGRLPKTLADLGFVEEEQATAELAKFLRLPLQHLGLVQRDNAALARLSAGFCEEHLVFPIALKNRALTMAMADPTKLDVVDLVASRIDARVQVVVAGESEILAAIARHYRGEERAVENNRARRAVSLQMPETPPPASSPPNPTKAILDAWGSYKPRGVSEQWQDFNDGTAPALTEDELVRLRLVQKNQVKATTVLRVLRELLLEKGYRL
jgi:hypothetical protein